MKRLVVLFVALALAGTACKSENKESKKGMVKVTMQVYNGSERVYDFDTVHMTREYDFYLELFRLYLAEIELKGANGSKSLSSIELLDPASKTANSFSVEMPEGDFDTFELGYGVDPVQNDLDPGSFDNDHPLSSYSSMYWSMLKYRFAKFEGKASSRDTAISNIFIAYHPGTDPLYHKKSYSVPVKVRNGQTTEIIMKMDINDLVDGPGGSIDFAKEPQTHSELSDIAIAIKFMANLAEAVEVNLAN